MDISATHPSGIQFHLHKFLENVLKAFFEKGIDIRDAGNVVF